MAEVWQLICHHTYAGTPGVIPDLSDGGSPGFAADGLADSDFLRDGAFPNSGSIRFYGAGRVHVPKGESWNRIGGIMGEARLRWQASPPGVYTIVYSDSFHFYIRNGVLVGWFAGDPVSYAEISVHNDQVGPQPYIIPTGKWVTLGFAHNGLDRMELSADGQIIARKVTPLNRVAAASSAGLSIGSTPAGDPLNGEIDEVKIWRLNPKRMVEQFWDRPMDDAAVDCYRRFVEELAAALARHPDCLRQVTSTARNTVESMLNEALAKGPETNERLHKLAHEYRRMWTAGQIDSPEMAKLLADTLKWLQLSGIDPTSDARVQNLIGSSCWQMIAREVKPPDCDTQLMALYQMLASISGSGRPRAAGA
jgi:hypothetical protein